MPARFYQPPLGVYLPGILSPAPAGADKSARTLSESDQIIIALDPDEARHARDVLRLRAGDEVELFDGFGLTVQTQLVEVTRHNVAVQCLSIQHHPPLVPRLTLAVALPKGERSQQMTSSLSQLGVDELIALRTGRSVTEPRESKLAKLERIAIESAKQCGRAHLMRIAPLLTLGQVLTEDHDLRLIATPHAEADADAALREWLAASRRVLVLIGAEGGWTAEELEQAQHAGCLPWSIAPHVLRIETAAAAAAALVRYLAGAAR